MRFPCLLASDSGGGGGGGGGGDGLGGETGRREGERQDKEVRMFCEPT